jgi:hypothetical protein
MKKFYIIMLALAVAVAMAVPAVAGDFSIKGQYVFDGETGEDSAGNTNAFYDDDLDLDLDIVEGDVSFHWDLELSDDQRFDGEEQENALYDNYYVTYQATDALSVKIGEYAIGFAGSRAADGVGNRNIGVGYALDAADIFLLFAKEDEGNTSSTVAYGPDFEDDDDILALTVTVKEAGPLTKLNFLYASATNELSAGDDDASIIGVGAALPAGPVSLDIEYASVTSDVTADDGGTYMMLVVGMDELVGFDLDLTYYAADAEWTAAFGEDWDPMKIFTDITDMTFIKLNASYAYNDDLSLAAAMLLSAENDAGADYGTEFDVSGTYTLADNASYAAGYASYSPDVGDGVTKMWHRLTLSF